jgi:hypothetical protein
MLDKRCLELLNIINGECQNCGYKIFAVQDLISCMPDYFSFDGAQFNECVYNLCEKGYISVKYQDDSEICLCPLTKGRLVFENQIDEEIEKHTAKRQYFIYSFLGALSGASAVSIFFVILYFIFGGR